MKNKTRKRKHPERIRLSKLRINAARPIPEAINGKSWDVGVTPDNLGIGGFTDLRNAQMGLPDPTHPSYRFVTIHELGHAKFSVPKDVARICKKYQCTPDDLQACEDLRIHCLMARLRSPFDGQPMLPDDVAPDTKEAYTEMGESFGSSKPSLRKVLEVLTTMQIRHRIAWPKVLLQDHGALSARFLDYRGGVRRKLSEPTPDNPLGHAPEDRVAEVIGISNKIAMSVARELTGMGTVGTLKRIKRMHNPKSAYEAARLLRKLLGDASELLGDDWDDGHDKAISGDASIGSSQTGRWGILKEVASLPLNVPHRPKHALVRYKQSVPVGSRLGHIRRLITDGRAFTRNATQKQEGGTILMDASGSMCISTDHIRQLLEQAPAATVAMYSAGTERGSITIIAKNGRMATTDAINDRREAVGECNVIDGPALDWLATQAEPRIWICDGHVTGVTDATYTNLCMEAAAKVRRNNIERHRCVRDYIDQCNA